MIRGPGREWVLATRQSSGGLWTTFRIRGSLRGSFSAWLAGTDPNDQSSTFRPLGTHDGTDYHLSVPTITGRSYKISISLNLQDWLPYGTLNGDDTSQVWTFDETTVPDGPFYSNRHPDRYFFRIEIGILNP
jgi:hypothetical protein